MAPLIRDAEKRRILTSQCGEMDVFVMGKAKIDNQRVPVFVAVHDMGGSGGCGGWVGNGRLESAWCFFNVEFRVT